MEWTCCACEHQVDERYFDTEERMCDECMNLAYPDGIADKEPDSSNINIQQVIDRLNNLELIGRNKDILPLRYKKELCEIVDVLSEIQKQIYATGVALNQRTKE